MGGKLLVTAGANGIGAQIARTFHAAGYDVFICDVDVAGMEALADELPGIGTAQCDVGDREAVRAMVAAAARHLGGLDVLVNNAGVPGPTAPLQSLDPDEWDRVVQVNLTGTFNVSQAAIPHLIAAGGGNIINMSSVAGRVGYPNRSPYASTKWAIIGLTKTLSIELGRHDIRVNALLPGAVAGPRADLVFERRAAANGSTVAQEIELALANQSLKALVEPSEIAAMALFLASGAAKSITGQAISIDGDMQHA